MYILSSVAGSKGEEEEKKGREGGNNLPLVIRKREWEGGCLTPNQWGRREGSLFITTERMEPKREGGRKKEKKGVPLHSKGMRKGLVFFIPQIRGNVTEKEKDLLYLPHQKEGGGDSDHLFHQWEGGMKEFEEKKNQSFSLNLVSGEKREGEKKEDLPFVHSGKGRLGD